MKGNLYNYRKLATIRESKYTQEKFAEIIGITAITLSRIENGHNASYEILIKICQVLDIDSNKIFYSTRQLALNS